MANIRLTHRTLKDLQSIYDFTTDKWGEDQADVYLEHFQEAFSFLQDNPSLLKINPNISEIFKVYLVKKHWPICDTVKDDIFVLTVRHVSMNLFEKLNELQPTLEEETKILSELLAKRK